MPQQIIAGFDPSRPSHAVLRSDEVRNLRLTAREIPAFSAIQVQPLSAIARLGRDIFFDTSLPSSGKVMDFYDFRDTNPEKVGADGKPQNPTAWMPRTALD